ncbi:unnamed protein product [Urochloa humidicola]
MGDSSSSSSDDSAVDTIFALAATNPLPSSQIQLINISNHITVQLDLERSNYGDWSHAFQVVLAKFGLIDHVDGSVAQGDPDWVQNDFAIVSWFYATVSRDIYKMVRTKADTAHSLWCRIRSLFLDNREMRSVYISAEFRTMVQGDLSIVAYCTKMKDLADQLTDLGTRITERDLVLNLLRGLNERYHGSIPVLTVHGLPSFLEARSHLLMEEHRLAQSQRLAQTSALVAQALPSVPYFSLAVQGASQPHATSQPHQQSSGTKKTKSKKKTGGNGSSSNRAPPPSQTYPNPWAGMFQAWQVPMLRPSAPPAGILGPRPGAPAPQQAHHTVAAPQPAPPSSAPQWDQSALIQALNNMAMQSSAQGPANWYLDTGASTHMSPGAGSSNQDGDSPM